ncbi:hypothetical protein [Wolbachia endosymbiont of Dirofilaria (Dirofilaria) immitis]|uniref:hypothetical protein n=1 Tax=Wolbachia endosymbiont of Dirofilaria (Dirofilaria) immitis TaxID=1812115 RepID=UPI00158D00F5|nr:hypothetical protein [Wolbachia endosymbiont of Dirofilaria (Dirofilaria) immitis]QKX02559.1 hypothetical protein GOY12_03365 [Wolbachia endosymbiont of Dirofilaria (Dirofilaria) immitis]
MKLPKAFPKKEYGKAYRKVHYTNGKDIETLKEARGQISTAIRSLVKMRKKQKKRPTKK